MSYFEDFEEYKIGDIEYEDSPYSYRDYRFWTTIEGEVLYINDMSISHIRNCIKMLERRNRTNNMTYKYMNKVLKEKMESVEND